MTEAGGQYGSIPVANSNNSNAGGNYGSVPMPNDAGGHYGNAPPELRINNGVGNIPPPLRNAGAGAVPAAGAPRRLSPRSGFGLPPPPNNNGGGHNDNYGSVPAPMANGGGGGGGDGNYGSVPTPMQREAGGQYGSAPPALKKEAGGQYGSAPPPMQREAAGNYGSAPPPMQAREAAGNYGSAPPPMQAREAAGNYGSAPPPMAAVSEASGNYGTAPKPKLNESFKGDSYWKPHWSRQAAEAVLRKATDTAGIVRPSSTPNTYCVSYKMGVDILHTLVEVDFELVKYIVIDIANARIQFDTMVEVLAYLGVTAYVEQTTAAAAPAAARRTPATGAGGGGGGGGGGRAPQSNSNAMGDDGGIFIPQPSRSPELTRRQTAPQGNWNDQQQQQQQQQRGHNRGGSSGGGAGFGASPNRAAGRGGPVHSQSTQSVRVEAPAPMGDYSHGGNYHMDDFNTPSGYGGAPPVKPRPGAPRNPAANPNFRTGYY